MDDEEIRGVITPFIKTANSEISHDVDSGLGWDRDKDWTFLFSSSRIAAVIMDDVTKSKSSMCSPSEIRRQERHIVRRRLFSNQESISVSKRPLEVPDTPIMKKISDININSDENNVDAKDSIIDAVDRLSDEPDLIADGSRSYSLPTVIGKHNDLKSISCHTMATLVRGNYSNEIENVTIIDCRYPYEYNGGHIKGAVNLYRREEIKKLLSRHRDQSADKNHIIIFHCEFSSERGPKMYRFLQSEDRDLHKDNYPQLYYPEVYLLDGGYKAFFESYKELCEPDNYTPMLHNDYVEDLRHFRDTSKSWAAGEKRHHSRQALRF
ncbi:hypothetical protein CHS0354_041079 [Potamilus streckersoni]|uniref:M-phase inducer phosphatase n=1 Tax=Potamilus streckersoni TaxID=2493646 RepID=A0AAE0SDW3_9BIVA|nr:hypothetical protein CHS0354_041079 [Potamilus streckersoni]